MEAKISRFPKKLGPDVEVREVDLDLEEVRFRGGGLTEARAVAVAEEILSRTPGRPSHSGPGQMSPSVTVRLPKGERARLATVAGCIGLALGLLDDWLTGNDPQAPKNLGQQVRPPAGQWLGERAANDILVLARKGRAFRSLHTLITQQGGEHVLYGSALALATTTQTWATATDTPVAEITHTALR